MPTAPDSEISQYLTFTLDEELYALDIREVHEVLEFTTLTKVPRTPDFMRGVINLRGHVVPVLDLRLKFGMPRTEKQVNTCIIITEVKLEGGTTSLGVLADSVHEVIEMSSSQVGPAPAMGTRVDTEFILGIGKRDDTFLILLDINRLFTTDEVRSAASGAPGAAAA